MGFAVFFRGDGRRHVDHSFDKFGLADVGHLFVAPLELIPRKPVACAKRWKAFSHSLWMTLLNVKGHDMHTPTATRDICGYL
jgi:hypothetical protein